MKGCLEWIAGTGALVFNGPETDLRPSSLRFSIASGLRLSARVFFLISLAVCLLPRLCSTCKKQKHQPAMTLKPLTVQGATPLGVHFSLHFLTLARNPPKWAPMLDSTFFFLASSSALFLASSSSFLCLSSWGSHLQFIIVISFIFSFTTWGNKILWSEQIADMQGLKQHMQHNV